MSIVIDYEGIVNLPDISYPKIMSDGPAELQSPPPNNITIPPKYETLRLDSYTALTNLVEAAMTGKITGDKLREAISLFVEHYAEQQRTIDDSLLDPLLGEQGFYTKRHFYGHVQEAIDTINNHPTPREKDGKFHGIALVAFDLDFFKRANDTYGHEWGDQVLQHVAGIISKNVKRKRDFIGRAGNKENTTPPSENGKTGRPGGEELAALLYDADIKGAVALADEIRQELETTPIKTPDGKDWSQTTSVGVYLLEPGVTLKEVINRADVALFHAKRKGRNCVSVWGTGMTMPAPQPAAAR